MSHLARAIPERRRCRRAGVAARTHQFGVSMIEVLVALLLVALGTLAIVLLQLTSKRNNLDAAQRATAAQIGYTFIERIRSNNSGDALAAYQAAAGSGARFGGGQQTYSGPDCGAGAACTPTQLAGYDARLFERELDGAGEVIAGTNVGGLISPRACLTADPPGGGSANFVLTIVWRGTSALPDTDVTCANSTGLYGADNEFRRTLTLNTFISARSP